MENFTYNYYTPVQIDAAYINALYQLIDACRKHDVKLNTVDFYHGGWRVTFEGYPNADAICHDNSYGSPYYGIDKKRNDWNDWGCWETIGFPWDYDDVSTHDADTLVRMINALNCGLDWIGIEDEYYGHYPPDFDEDDDFDE